MSPFDTKAWWTVRLSDLIGGRIFKCNTTSELELVVLAGLPSLHRKGGTHMLTLEGLIAVISLALTAFSLGYAIGRNSKAKE